MNKINLDELKRHATAYLPDENRRAHPAHVQEYYRHCGPEAMLALIRVARAAEQIYNLLPWDFGHCTSVKELEEAMKEIAL